MQTLLIVDDAAAEKATNIGNKGSFSRLCLASPHLRLSIFGIFQRLTACSCSLRDNTEALISYAPSKTRDIDIIIDEFNPSPADLETKKIVKSTLLNCWGNYGTDFAFIYRPPRIGHVYYYRNFDTQITIPGVNVHPSHVRDNTTTPIYSSSSTFVS